MKPIAPSWQKDAVISSRGWHHPKTNELLVSRKFSSQDIEAFLAGDVPEKVLEEFVVDEASSPEVEKPKKPKRKSTAKKKAKVEEEPTD